MGSSFTRGTTPDFRFEIPQDLSGWDVYLTFGQRGKEIVTIRDPDVRPANGGCVIEGRLTQEQTLKFKAGEGEAQVRCWRNGTAAANPLWFRFTVHPIILQGAIPKERQ